MLHIIVPNFSFYITVIKKSLWFSRCTALISAEKVTPRYATFLKLFPQQTLLSKGCTWTISRYGDKLSSREETAI